MGGKKMPVLNSRHDYTKVYRPKGTLFSQGEADGEELRSIIDAIKEAIDNFAKEFGRAPEQERAIVEVVFGTFNCVATVFEIPEQAD